MRIESMHIYPVKSMRGIPVERTILTASGLLGDRRFMVVDPNGQFITQRNARRWHRSRRCRTQVTCCCARARKRRWWPSRQARA